MKICFLTKNLDVKTGAGRYSRDIIENITKEKNVEAVVLTEQASGHKSEFPILKESFLLRNFLNIFINALRIRKFIKDCDITHALDGYPYGVIAAMANIGLDKKLVISGVGTYSVLPLDRPIKKYFLKWAYRKADKILCISKFTEQQILKRIKLNNTAVINLGVNLDKFSAQGGPAAVDQQISNELKKKKEKIILSVGALKPRKGYHISIPTVAEIKKRYPNIKYYIVGGKPPKIYLDLIEKHNLKKSVKFSQGISDYELVKLYYQADVFLLTPITIDSNNFEGFGLVFLEAGICGKPVVGTYNCGAEDAIVDGKTGFLVPQNDVKKTTEAVLKFLDNPELSKKLGENGKKRAQQMSWDNVAKKYIKIYNEYENNFN